MLKLLIRCVVVLAPVVLACAVEQGEVVLACAVEQGEAAEHELGQLPSESALADLRSAVAPAFADFAQAIFELDAFSSDPKEKDNKEKEESLRKAKRDAHDTLLEQVKEHWPYDAAPTEELRQRMRDNKELILALYNDVFQGYSSREEAVSELRKIIEELPRTTVAADAYVRMAYLYWNGEPREEEKFYATFREMLDSEIPFGGHTVMALENIATDADSNAERFENRKQLSSYLRELHDPAELSKELLIPLPNESEAEFLFRIEGSIDSISTSYRINGINLIGESMLTEEPQETLQELMEEEKDNPYVQRELKDSGLDKPLVKEEFPTGRVVFFTVVLGLILFLVFVLWRRQRIRP